VHELPSHRLAAPRPGAAASAFSAFAAAGVPVLLCRAGGRDLGFEAGSVLEVRPGVAPCAVPGVVPPVLGLTVVRGAVVPVFDLAVALGLSDQRALALGGEGSGAAAAPLLVVLRDGERWAGALVDAVGEVLALPAAAWRAGAAWPGLPAPGLVRGEAWHEGRRLWLLETAALMRAPSTGLADPVDAG
jgi:chemotaxis signal transduction protein